MKGFFLTEWAFLGMRWLYEQLEGIFGQGSVAICFTVLLVTLLLKAATLFSDIKSRKSSLKMQLVQPDIQKLQKKYANDPQKLNIEQRKLMKEKGVSMMGGCLPMLLTLPLFFIFISAFRSWSNEQTLRLVVEADANPQAAVETMESYQFLWINNIWRPDSPVDSNQPVMDGETFYNTFNQNIDKYYVYIDEDTGLKQTLTDWKFFDNKDEFIKTYEEKMEPVVAVNAGYNNGIGILALIAGATTFLSSWIMQRGQPKSPDGKQPGKFMTYLFPLMTVFFCWQYDTTFALYWIFSNIIATVIGVVLNRWFKKQSENQVEVIK